MIFANQVGLKEVAHLSQAQEIFSAWGAEVED